MMIFLLLAFTLDAQIASCVDMHLEGPILEVTCIVTDIHPTLSVVRRSMDRQISLPNISSHSEQALVSWVAH